ncbi:MAG: NAD(P)H-binding protein [Pseudomonadota bacterium]
MGLKVTLVGATGLVGSACLRQLVEDPGIESIQVLARHAPDIDSDKVTVHLLDFDAPELPEGTLAGDAFVCALGTTIKKAGSPEAFARVDRDYVLKLAQLARQHGTPHCAVVSAVGADPTSRVLYSRIKGEMEQGLGELGFDSLTLVRPSLLLGARQETRFGEDLGKPVMRALAPLMMGQLARYRPVQAERVAQTLVGAVHRPGRGTRVVYPTVEREIV